MVKNEDIISNLPDPIIHHILSFLDIKYVVPTCVLSKRWTSLWTSLSILNFNYHTYFNTYFGFEGSSEKFIDFVNKVLFFHDSSSNIHTISLSYAPLTMDTWIYMAISHNIQVLDLNIRSDQKQFKLPQCLLTCKSLVILKLDIKLEEMILHDWIRDERAVFVTLPESVNLPRLRVLHLRSFCFCDNEFTRKLIPSCPVLDNLSIINCGLYETDSLTIYATQLKHLEIDGIIACYKHTEMYLQRRCKILMYAPMLTSFKCRGFIGNEYLLGDLPSLVKADIQMEVTINYIDAKKERAMHPNLTEDFGRNMIKFLGVLYNVQSLTLSTWLLEVLETAIGIPSSPFYNLRHLKLKTWLYTDCIHGINHILENSCNLETLIIEIPTTNLNSAKLWIYWETYLCNLYHLRSIEMRNVAGCIYELKFLKFLLKNAIVLENLIIFFQKGQSPDNQKQLTKSTKFMEILLVLPDNQRQLTEFTEILLSYPKASSNVAIVFF